MLTVMSLTAQMLSPSVQVAAITVAGVVFTALASFVGMLLKSAFDRRTEARLAAENAHNAMLALDAEKRLQLDIAVRAIQLLSTPSGAPSLPIQRAGALFTLCSLSQFNLTLALLNGLLAGDEVDSATAARIIDEIIRRGDETQQNSATSLLVTHTRRFLSQAGYELPQVFLDGCGTCSEHTRAWFPQIVARLLLCRPLSEWHDYRGKVVSLVVSLVLHWRNAKGSWFVADSASILRAILPVLFPHGGILQVGNIRVDMDAIRKDLVPMQAATMGAIELIEHITLWARSSAPSEPSG